MLQASRALVRIAARSIAGSLEFLGLGEANLTMLLLVAAITALATASVASGPDVGIQWLSHVNLVLAGASCSPAAVGD